MPRAGHEIPITLSASGETSLLEHSRGMPLGLMEQPLIDASSMTIHPDELVLLYTDGITDGLNLESNGLGTDGLQVLIKTGCGLNAQDLCIHLADALCNLQDGKPQFDDVTLVAIRSNAQYE